MYVQKSQNEIPTENFGCTIEDIHNETHGNLLEPDFEDFDNLEIYMVFEKTFE